MKQEFDENQALVFLFVADFALNGHKLLKEIKFLLESDYL